MPFRNSITAGTILRIPAIQSPNFVSGASGWIIRQDGTAEFSDVEVRGTLDVVGPSGAHITADPGVTNPVLTFTSPDGTNDAFINIVPGAANNAADLGINSGTWTPADGVVRRSRLFMDGFFSDDTQLAVVRASDDAIYGGFLSHTSQESRWGYANAPATFSSYIIANNSGVLQANRHIQDTNPQTWLYQGSVTTTGAFTAEQIMGTLVTFNFLPHRSYIISYQFQFNVATSGAVMIVRLRDTNLTGTQRGIMAFPGTQVGNIPHSAKGEFYVANTTGATISRAMCITASSTGGSIAVQTAGGINTTYLPWLLRIDEDKSDTDNPWSVSL